MKKIIFFTQNRWAFGSIHHALAKELWKHGVYANLLDWTVGYTKEEFALFRDGHDLFVTMPEAVLTLHRDYEVPLNRIIAVAHGQWDILLAKSQADFDFYPHLAGFGVISNILYEKCKEWEISVEPKIVPLGIHVKKYIRDPARELRVVGYGGANETKNWFGQEIKRPHLVEKTLDGMGLELKRHKFYNHLAMAGYYGTVDCILQTSMEEAGGLPMMEAAASGRLPIGTPVGYLPEHAPSGGLLAPLEEGEFVEKTREYLSYYKANPDKFRKKCMEVQEFAYRNYDWKLKIRKWMELFKV
jgi:glycosyltransferase involved in cell wall biosynthesis